MHVAVNTYKHASIWFAGCGATVRLIPSPQVDIFDQLDKQHMRALVLTDMPSLLSTSLDPFIPTSVSFIHLSMSLQNAHCE